MYADCYRPKHVNMRLVLFRKFFLSPKHHQHVMLSLVPIIWWFPLTEVLVGTLDEESSGSDSLSSSELMSCFLDANGFLPPNKSLPPKYEIKFKLTSKIKEYKITNYIRWGECSIFLLGCHRWGPRWAPSTAWASTTRRRAAGTMCNHHPYKK